RGAASRQPQTACAKERETKIHTPWHGIKITSNQRRRNSLNCVALGVLPRRDYFCQVRFWWRLARSCLRRLCLLILLLRRFFSEPIGDAGMECWSAGVLKGGKMRSQTTTACHLSFQDSRTARFYFLVSIYNFVQR